MAKRKKPKVQGKITRQRVVDTLVARYLEAEDFNLNAATFQDIRWFAQQFNLSDELQAALDALPARRRYGLEIVTTERVSVLAKNEREARQRVARGRGVGAGVERHPGAHVTIRARRKRRK